VSSDLTAETLKKQLRIKLFALLTRREYSAHELRQKLTQSLKPKSAPFTTYTARQAQSLDDEFEQLGMFTCSMDDPFDDVVDADAESDEIEPLNTTLVINEVLTEFAENNWQSDARFAEAWVLAHVERQGEKRIRQDLRQRGVSDVVIEAALTNWIETGGEDELSRAEAIWHKQFGGVDAELRQTLAHQNKQFQFLLRRGFSSDIAQKIIKNLQNDTSYL
jgi:regulatory protein